MKFSEWIDLHDGRRGTDAEDRVRQFPSRRRRHNVDATTDATCNSRRWRHRRRVSTTRRQMATPGQNSPPLQWRTSFIQWLKEYFTML